MFACLWSDVNVGEDEEDEWGIIFERLTFDLLETSYLQVSHHLCFRPPICISLLC